MDYLVAIRSSLAMAYRPVLIYFETKRGDDWVDINPSNDCDDRSQKLGLALDAVNQVFGGCVELHEFVDQVGRYPTVPEMAGKAIIYYPQPEFTPGKPQAPCQGNPPFKGTLFGNIHDDCTRREDVENEIKNRLIQGMSGWVYRVDQYQSDWTFEYGVPPNPIVVNGSAQSPTIVRDAQGDDWNCDNGDVSHGEVVSQQGTFRFPFKTVGCAIARAQGTTSNGIRDQARAGFGWTVLIRPGSYAESLTIDIPLTLKKDDRFEGPVVIGG